VSLQFAAEGRTRAGLPQPSWQGVTQGGPKKWHSFLVRINFIKY